MKVLVVGGGGREHTIIWKLAQSDSVDTIYAAPGNAGTNLLATNVDIGAEDVTALAKFAVSEKVDLVVVGPEVPLCMGLADIVEEAGIPVFGPSAAAARIEGSKAFSKQLMKKYNVPTAAFGDFENFDEAVAYAQSLDADMWIKASGLAAGKGAVYAADPDEAEKILRGMMVEDEFGDSGHRVVIEENMKGEEASIFALCDGADYRLLVSSQDHKRVGEGDTGPNTGGMGAYAPAPIATPELIARVEKEVIEPTLAGMASEGCPYKGLLYAGIMVTEDGAPKVVEFNCRFGDPETQAVLPLLDGDLGEIMMACATGKLSTVDFVTSDGFAMCVVMASGGYPGSYKKGYPINGLFEAAAVEGAQVFHAGTKLENDDVLTSGGRVLGITGWGKDFFEARDRAYKAVESISFKDVFYRNDIGHRAAAHLKNK